MKKGARGYECSGNPPNIGQYKLRFILTEFKSAFLGRTNTM